MYIFILIICMYTYLLEFKLYIYIYIYIYIFIYIYLYLYLYLCLIYINIYVFVVYAKSSIRGWSYACLYDAKEFCKFEDFDLYSSHARERWLFFAFPLSTQSSAVDSFTVLCCSICYSLFLAMFHSHVQMFFLSLVNLSHPFSPIPTRH